MSTLAIIGTCGRGDDEDRFRKEPRLWRAMQAVTQIVVEILKPDTLVSGGAAISDHLAVLAYLNGSVPALTLHLPALFSMVGAENRFDPTSSAGATSNRYHVDFYHMRKVDSLDEIAAAIKRGAKVTTPESPAAPGYAAFFKRNTKVAQDADVLLAFTFGNGSTLKDGGTKDTWDKYMALPTAKQDPKPPGNFISTPRRAYHYDLNSCRLYSA